MPASGYRDRVGCSDCGTTGILGRPLTGQALHAGMGPEPRVTRSRIAIGQHLHRTTRVAIDADGPVEPALTKGDIIHPEHPRGGAGWHHGAGDDPQERPAAGAHVQATSDPGPSAAAQGKPQGCQCLGQARGTPGMPRDQMARALGTRAAGTGRLIAAKAPDPQPERHPLIAHRPVARRAARATVDA
jgi:hypothetical protein